MKYQTIVGGLVLWAGLSASAQSWQSLPAPRVSPDSLRITWQAARYEALAPYRTDGPDRFVQDSRALLDSSRVYIIPNSTGERLSGNLTTYTYDANGRLVQTTITPGIGYPVTRTRITHDGPHQLRTYTDTKSTARAAWTPQQLVLTYMQGDTVTGGEILDWSPAREVWVPVSRTITHDLPDGGAVITLYTGDTTTLAWIPVRQDVSEPDGMIQSVWDTTRQAWKITHARWQTPDTWTDFALNELSGTYNGVRLRFTYRSDTQLSLIDYAYAEVAEASLRDRNQISWSPSAQVRYTYDNASRSIAIYTYQWEGRWAFNNGDTLLYDTQGRIRSIIGSIWYAGTRHDVRRETYAYDTLGHQQVRTLEERTPTTAWQYIQRILSDTTATGSPLFVQEDIWKQTAWQPYAETSYAYEDRTVTTYLRRWTPDSLAWTPTYAYTTETDADGRILRQETRQWRTGAWVCTSCFNYSYTPEGDISRLAITYDTYTTETLYYYQLYQNTDPASAPLTCLTANPWQPGTPIQCTGLDPEQTHHLVVSDLQGRVIYKTPLAGTEPVYLPATLRPGLYLLYVYDADGQPVVTQKGAVW